MKYHIGTILVFIFTTSCGGSISWKQNLSQIEPPPESPQLRFVISPDQNRTAISPYIYGTNTEKEVNSSVSLYRMGGNRWTTFNWENNSSNGGKDNGHKNGLRLCDLQNCTSSDEGQFGSALRLGVKRAFDAGATPLVTIPIADYVAADSTSTASQNASSEMAPWKYNRAKNPKGAALTPDTNDMFVYQDESVLFLQNEYGTDLLSGKKIFYMLDNEPELWSSTHKFAHPEKVTYQKIVDRTVLFGEMIKEKAPNAIVFGGVAYGYNGYNSLQDAPDRHLGDNVGKNFFAYFLNQLKNRELVTGKRAIDVIDMHWGSEARGGGHRVSEEESIAPNTPEVVAARLQAPRSLWDPTYVEDSWIAEDMTRGPIAMIPRLREIINNNYPGIKLSFSEYAHGGEKHISGGLAQVDTLGIFAREGVFAASHWDREEDAPFIYGAMRLYTNYDGLGSKAGDISVLAQTTDNEKTSVYALASSSDSDHLSIIVLNKTGTLLDSQIELPETYTYLKSYELKAGPNPQPTQDLKLGTNSVFHFQAPAMSATLLILKKGTR